MVVRSARRSRKSVPNPLQINGFGTDAADAKKQGGEGAAYGLSNSFASTLSSTLNSVVSWVMNL